MVKAIALHSVIPVRQDADEASEQETQMLFAETCTVLEQKPSWWHIRLDVDQMEGWVDQKMLTPLSASEWDTLQTISSNALVCMPMAYAVSSNNGQTIPLTAGTRLPNYENGEFQLLGVRFRIDPAMVLTQALEMSEEHLKQSVRFFLNTPYLWGGKNAMGMDCSGFVQVIMSLYGHVLPRNARQQIKVGEVVNSLKDAQAGDLAFFDHDDDKISHVGILLDANRIIHCSGRVKVEQIDEKGIFSVERGGIYTHHLKAIRRY